MLSPLALKNSMVRKTSLPSAMVSPALVVAQPLAFHIVPGMVGTFWSQPLPATGAL